MRFRSVVVLAVAVVMVAWMLMASESARAGWQAQESGVRLPLLAVAFGDSAHGCVTTGIADMYDHILATGDGGATWSQRSYKSYHENLFDVAFADRAYGWAVGYWDAAESTGGTIVRTVNGGKRWHRQYRSPMGNYPLYGVACAGRDRVWAVGNYGKIVATANGGASWRIQRRSGSYANVLYDVSFPDRTHGWAVGSRGQILTTANGGKRWSAQRSGTTKPLRGVEFADRTRGWIVGSGGTILATSDGGLHWHRQASGVQEALVGVTFVSRRLGWAVGRAGTILATSDGGVTWGRSYSAPYGLRAVTCIGNKGVIAVGDEGTILSSPLPGVAGARGQRESLDVAGKH